MFSNGLPHGYGYVEAVAISPDGKEVATAMAQFIAPEMSGPGPVQLWDVASGRKLLEIEHPSDGIIDNVQFLPDGKRIVTASTGYYPIQIWDVKTGQRLLALREHPVSIYSSQMASFSPDGRLIATEGRAGTDGHYYGTVNIRNSTTGQMVFTLENTTNCFFDSAQFSPDGKLILTAEYVRGVNTNTQGLTTIWDAKTGWRIRNSFQGFDQFTPDGHKIICKNKDGISVWDIKSEKEIQRFAIPDSFPKPDEGWEVDQILLSDDGKRLVVHYLDASRRGTQTIMALWNTDTGKLIKQFNEGGMKYWERIVGFSPKSENFLLIGKDGKPELYDGATGKLLKTLEQYQQP
jgi:WD40 repeat protein